VALDTREPSTDGRPRGLPGLGLVKGLMITLKHMLRPSVTQQYPDEKPDLPPRTRGVIALKEANCTVCYKCSRECPDWCIYIDAHKETHDPAAGGRARSVKVLDRFAIDYALCMYCGICVEVCPFDALFWSPEFEYATYDIVELTHEKEKLEEWTYTVLPPPGLELGAEPPPEVLQASPPVTGTVSTPVDTSPTAAPSAAAPAVPAPEVAATAPAPATTPAPAGPTPEEATPNVAAAGEQAVEPTAPGPRGERVELALDQPTFDRVLAEELTKGTDRRVAEGKARRAAMIEAKRKAGEG